jgi:hypothetical protein
MARKTRLLTVEEMQRALQRVEGQLPENLYKLLQDIVASYTYIGKLVSYERMTVNRLRKLLGRGRRRNREAEINSHTRAELPPATDDVGSDADA